MFDKENEEKQNNSEEFNIDSYDLILDLLKKSNVDLDVLCAIYNCFYDFDSRNVNYDSKRVIEIFTTNQDIIYDCRVLIINSLEDVFDEVEERL